MLKKIKKDKEGFTKEDALIYILDLLEGNGKDMELTIDEYKSLL